MKLGYYSSFWWLGHLKHSRVHLENNEELQLLEVLLTLILFFLSHRSSPEHFTWLCSGFMFYFVFKRVSYNSGLRLTMMTMMMVTTVTAATFLRNIFLQQEHFSLSLPVTFPLWVGEDRWPEACRLGKCVNCRRNEVLLLDMYLVKPELIYHVFQETKVRIRL